MASTNLIQLSQDLAYKLQDPAASGTTDGERWTADGRLGYLRRAYRRFYRILTQLYPELVNKIFKADYQVSSSGLTSATGTFDISALDDVFEVFCKLPTDEEWNRATYVMPDEYISTYTSYSDFYDPNYNASTFYWSVLNDEIAVLPPMQYSLFYSYREDTAASLSYTDSVEVGDNDIDMSTIYWDILLSFAAAEAYMDIGQADMVAIYKKDVNEQLQLLAIDKQEKEKDDEMA